MYNIYFAAPIDTCLEEALKQIKEFKLLFTKFPKLNVYGAGYKNSPIITPESSLEYKGIVTAYDLRKLRNSDILLVVTNLKQFCPGTFIEFEHARNLGIYIIVLILPIRKECKICCGSGKFGTSLCGNCNGLKYVEYPQKLKNIFIESMANKIVYGKEELEKILEKLNNEM